MQAWVILGFPGMRAQLQCLEHFGFRIATKPKKAVCDRTTQGEISVCEETSGGRIDRLTDILEDAASTAYWSP